MNLNLHLPENVILKPCITVFGVGGAGGNAVNNMISSRLEGVKFVVANTDAQALEHSQAERRIQLGETLTRGLGAGAAPAVGKAAAEETINEVMNDLQGSNMVFITAGMGGGTGTGAAPVIAKMAREQGILTVGVVTKPFHFEGSHRMKIAEQGLQELQKYVDTLIIIPNQNLFRIANEKTTFADAFKMADDVLHSGVRGVTDLMMMPGLINLDFADIRTVMSEMGKAMMGTGEASGEKRSLHAAEAAISNPLLDNVSMKGARGVLINITGGSDMTLFEVDEAANRIRDEVDPDANIIFGSAFNASLEGTIRVSVVATGIDSHLMNSQPTSSSAHHPNHQSGPIPQQSFSAEPPRRQETATQPVTVAPVATSHSTPAPTSAPAPAPIAPPAPAATAPVTTSAAAPVVTAPTISAPTTSIKPPVYNEVELDLTDDDIFVAPRPIEPRSQTAVSYTAPGRTPDLSTPVRPSSQEASLRSEEREAPRSSGMGLFDRMANTIRGNRSTYEQEEAPAASKVTEERREPTTSESKEDVLDIPAFLRRKITN